MIKEFQGEYRWLSNFWPCKIILDGLEYKSVEHAYMSAKNSDPLWKKKCQEIDSPGQIKKLSRGIKLPENWTVIKLQVMRDCLKQKFSYENPLLREKLKRTGDEHIQEGNHWGDTFWGVDLRTGDGQNHLGFFIMEIRSTL